MTNATKMRWNLDAFSPPLKKQSNCASKNIGPNESVLNFQTKIPIKGIIEELTHSNLLAEHSLNTDFLRIE